MDWWLALAGFLALAAVLAFLAPGPGMNGMGVVVGGLALMVALTPKPEWFDD